MKSNSRRRSKNVQQKIVQKDNGPSLGLSGYLLVIPESDQQVRFQRNRLKAVEKTEDKNRSEDEAIAV
jgi:hypothetical protein